MSACADFSMNMFLFTQTDGRYEGTDTDTGGSQVADFIDFQAGVKPSGTRQNIFYLVCCYRIQTAAKGVELDKFQILLGLYKLDVSLPALQSCSAVSYTHLTLPTT